MRILILLLALAQSTFAAAEADILVAFDNSYTDGVGGDENAEVLTANSVAASNWINEQSGTPARMRVCGYHKTTGQGGRSTLGGYVGWLAWYGDGNLDDVTTAADAAPTWLPSSANPPPERGPPRSPTNRAVMPPTALPISGTTSSPTNPVDTTMAATTGRDATTRRQS